jgi:uncharacterized protein YcfL
MKKTSVVVLAIIIVLIATFCSSISDNNNYDDENIVFSETAEIIKETNLPRPTIESTGIHYFYNFTSNQPDVSDVIVGYGYLEKMNNV